MVSKGLVLIGGGGHCKSILDTVLILKKYAEIVIVDANIPAETQMMGCNVVGNDEMLSELFKVGFTEAFITIGSIKDTSLRHKLYDKAEAIGFTFPNIIDSSAVVSKYVNLGGGVFIGKSAVVNADSDIGKMAIINSGSIIEHECKIGEFSHISVGTVLCGNVTVGERTFIGANTTVVQGIKIGRDSVIGAGSLVLRDIDSYKTVYGKITE